MWTRLDAAITAVLLALSACSADGGTGSTPPETRQPSDTGSATVEEVTRIDGVLSIPAEPFADWVTATESGVWVANVGPGLVCYDAEGTEIGSVPAGSIDLAMEVGFESLWAGADAGPDAGELLRVLLSPLSPEESVVRIPVPALAEESSIAITDDAVWLLSADRSLVKVDPSTNTVATTVRAPEGAFALRGGFGALWVTLGGLGQVARLDPATGEETGRIEVGAGAAFLAIGAGSVWVMNQIDGTVSRVDPERNSVAATVEGLGRIQGGDIAATDDAVWVRTSQDLAVGIDVASDEVVRRIGPPQGSGSIDIAADGSVWISAHDANLVHRIP